MKLNKQQATVTFGVLDILAMVVAIALMATGHGVAISYWMLATVVILCQSGKYLASKMPNDESQ
jgi:hypothetical protein